MKFEGMLAVKIIEIDRQQPPEKKMSDGLSSVTGGMKESSLMWPMLSRCNYSGWVMLMQCNYEAMEIWETIEPGGAGVKRAQD